MWRELLGSPVSWLLLALAVALGGWGWSARSAAKAKGDVTTLQTSLKAAEEKTKETERREQLKETAIATLTRELTTQAQAAQQLQGQLDQLAQAAATRADTIKRLKRENAELRAWADRPLPDPVIRLLQRPALTGATDYQAHLSGPEPLPAAAGSATQ
ncbi:Rz-like lysis system protein LysB [Aeromonas veronii]|uniref:Rz-like lysis system protein LysB n=1 Tax=Aeromonas veronii TaxID=654 RepID=UPI003F7C79C9